MIEKSNIRIDKSLVDQIRKIEGSNDSERIIKLLSNYNKTTLSKEDVVNILKAHQLELEAMTKSLKKMEDLIYQKSGY